MEKFTDVDGNKIYIDPSAVTFIKVTKTDIEINFVGGDSVVVSDNVASVLGAINAAKLAIVE